MVERKATEREETSWCKAIEPFLVAHRQKHVLWRSGAEQLHLLQDFVFTGCTLCADNH